MRYRRSRMRVASHVLVQAMIMSLPFVAVNAFVPTTLSLRTRQPSTLSSSALFVSTKPKEPNVTPILSTPIISATATNTTKFRTLKDIMWVRETQEDLTAAEFACSIDTKPDSAKKRAIDYDNLLQNLDSRILDMACEDKTQCEVSVDSPSLTPGKGMSSIVYTETQRNVLLRRILKTRKELMRVIQSHAAQGDDTEEQQSFSLPLPELKIPKEEDDPSAMGPKLYVRDDGTVDWDGALQDRAALRNFGTAVWARINGQNPEQVSEDALEEMNTEGSSPEPVTVKIEETEAIRTERAKLDSLKKELSVLEEEHTALLNSALKRGQAVATITLATIEPSLRSQIRESSDRLEIKREKVIYQTLIYELERIYTYLSGELGNPSGYIPLQDRLNVAEFGLLESQIQGFSRLLEMGDEPVDADVLQVVSDQVTDFKRRLGIDYYVTGVTLDWPAIRRWLKDLVGQAKKGVAFYVKGCELFWNDIVFCLTLVGRALQGYTLKPREVRNLRRTFKDIITFIPVVIILIIPLSPVGHVMVFGAIQRFFPDFFPSCFTERRQNLLSLYESTEYTEVKIDEGWRDKVARLASAFAYLLSSVYLRLVSALSSTSVRGIIKGGEDQEVNGQTKNKREKR